MCIHKRFPFSAIYRTSIVMLYLTSMYLSIYLNTYKIKNQKISFFKIKAFRLFCFAPEKAGYHSGYQSRYPAQYPKRHHDQALFLLNFFAADMFNFYFKKLYSFSRAFDFLIDQLFIRIVFHRNLFQDFRCFCTFFQ